MKRIIGFCMLSLVFTAMSCGNGEKLEGGTDIEPVDSIPVFLGLPTAMKLQGDKLFVVDMFAKESMIKVIDLTTKNLIMEFAKKGDGPKEYVHIGNIDIYEEEGRLKLNIYDPMMKRLGIYDYDSLAFLKENYEPSIKNLSAIKNMRYTELLRLGKGYLATGITEGHKYTILSDSFQEIDFFGEYRPKPMAAIPESSHVIANYGNTFISREKNLLVEVVYNAAVLSCYDLNRRAKKWEYLIHELDYQMKGNRVINKGPMGYLSACIAGEYIYALYSGERDNPDALATYGEKIHVFGLDGSLVTIYNLSRSGFSHCVDAKGKKLYVLTHDPEPNILIYELP